MEPVDDEGHARGGECGGEEMRAGGLRVGEARTDGE